jgi:hypothetical protein
LVSIYGLFLDDKRTPQPDKSDLADILSRWRNRDAEVDRARTDQSFLVPKSEIADNYYDLSINRYKEVVYEAVEYDPPKVILERLAGLEEEIANGRAELGGAVGMNRVPRDWTMKPLGDVATLQRGFDLPVQDRHEGPVKIFAANGPIGTHNVHKVRGP